MQTFNSKSRSYLRPLGYCSMAIMISCNYQPNIAGNATVSDANQPDSPNILFILTDDQAWGQVSKPMHPDIPSSGSTYLETPNIDRLGDSGIRFYSGYAPAPLCTPTRRSILTGTSVARSGSEFRSPYVPAEHLTIPFALRLANPDYLCAHFGKWGGTDMISSPEECGFDISDGMTGNNEGGMPSSLGGFRDHRSAPPHFIDNEDPKRTFSVTDSAIKFMQRATTAGKPFFVQVSYYAVHLSIVAREASLQKYVQKGSPDRGYPPAFAAMLDDMDEGVGRLLNALNVLGIADNTYIVLMSDNGGQEDPMPGINPDLPRLNHPLSGAKQSLLEGGIRVPFIVSGPGIDAGGYCAVPVSGYDLLPTFYELAGGKTSLPGKIDGGSIVPLLKNPVHGHVARPTDGLIFHRPGFLSSAIRQGPYKLFITWNASGEIESRNLYNLDINVVENEQTDISHLEEALANSLQKTLMDHLHEVNAETPLTVIENLPGQRGVRPPPVR
jgi:arylsulfatase A